MLIGDVYTMEQVVRSRAGLDAALRQLHDLASRRGTQRVNLVHLDDRVRRGGTFLAPLDGLDLNDVEFAYTSTVVNEGLNVLCIDRPIINDAPPTFTLTVTAGAALLEFSYAYRLPVEGFIDLVELTVGHWVGEHTAFADDGREYLRI